MQEKEGFVKWINRGKQRREIAQILRKPLTPSEIYNEAKKHNSKIRLQDIWYLMGEFENRKLIKCLNPDEKNGKLFYFTNLGRSVIKLGFDISPAQIPNDIDWEKYSYIIRGKTRNVIFNEIGRSQQRGFSGITAMKIKKQLHDSHPIGINPTVRALRELLGIGLIQCIGLTKKPKRKLYGLSETGDKIFQELLR